VPFRLVPPLWEVLPRTRFVLCNIRCTGRPRPIPDDDVMRLRGKVFRRDVLWRAWISVQRNRGAPGIDQITLGHVEQYGVTRLLGELAAELGEGRYRPLPTRRVFIPKPGTSEQRRTTPGKPCGHQRLRALPPINATAPAFDPPCGVM
jgi:hypothetical protein